MYLALAKERDIVDCFFVFQEMRELPIKKKLASSRAAGINTCNPIIITETK